MKLFNRPPRFEILVIAGVALLSFVITLVVVAASSGARARRVAAAAAAERQQNAKPPLFSPEELAITADDFILPASPATDRSLDYVPYRPRLPRWSRELVDAYWVPPSDIAAEIVGTINDQNMERLFQKVP
ncbi:MAG TPA: hypothetical protein VHE79_05245 [Spirochaetia bacterium]